MKRFFVFGLMTLFFVMMSAQERNTFSVHRHDATSEQMAVDEIDSVFMDVLDGESRMNIRMTDSSLRSYTLSSLDYMDFIYVEKGPQAVDLGLSSLWASYNIGATSPEECGDFFAWGETVAKSDYTEESYLYYKHGTYEKIANNISGTEYDAATVQWGSPWRIPNRYEMNELMQCEWTAATLNGVDGYRVTGKTGNSIFLPAAGYYNGTARVDTDNRQGYYWSSSVNMDMPSSAYNINFKGYDAEWSASRFYGFCIRPVRDYKSGPTNTKETYY